MVTRASSSFPSGTPDGAAAEPIGFGAMIAMAPGSLGLAIAAAVLSAALSLVPFWLLYRIASALLAPVPDRTLALRMAEWAFGVLLLRWVLMALSHGAAHIGAFSVQRRLRLAMARRLGEVPMRFFAGRGSGALRRTLNDDVDGMEGFLAHMLPDAVAAAAVPLFAAALLFVVDWRMALAALLPLPFALLAQAVLTRRSSARMAEWGELQKRIANQLGEYVRGVQVVKAFGLSARSFADLAASVHAASAWVAGYARGSSAGWVLFSGLLSANLIVVAPVGAWLHRQGTLDTPTYVLFLLVAPAILLPLLRLTFALGEQMHRREALVRINSILTAPTLADRADARIPSAPLDIVFDDVRLRYGDRLALDGVGFQAKAGCFTALVGPSGSGKSSLARLLPRLYEAESGAVRLGGTDVQDWPLDALLDTVAVVFQDVHLFHASVCDNLRMGRPGAPMEDIVAAARAARAHDFITALPQGYDTLLGERGARLSGGERQRLSIARALLKDAPVLVLDEATSYADAENEVLIQQALAALCQGRTVLMIAHRLQTVVAADRIVVLDAGRVAGQGTHDELLRDCALYARLWRDHEEASHWSLGAAGTMGGRA